MSTSQSVDFMHLLANAYNEECESLIDIEYRKTYVDKNLLGSHEAVLTQEAQKLVKGTMVSLWAIFKPLKEHEGTQQSPAILMSGARAQRDLKNLAMTFGTYGQAETVNKEYYIVLKF
jgi:hypothetical protein